MKKLNFDKYYDSYNKTATVQKKVANNLLKYISKNNYNSVIELGCGTGIFTNLFVKQINYNSLDLNDYFDTTKYFTDITYNNFITGDMSNLQLKNYDLIISSSAFQWIENFEIFIKNLSQYSNELVFSIYIKNNLKEIYQHFGVSLNYLSYNEIFQILKKYYSKVEGEEEKIVLNFNSPLDALKHLKYTGVTGFSKTSFSKIRTFNSLSLTYKIGYFSAHK